MPGQPRPEGAGQKWFPRMRTDQPVPGPTAEQVERPPLEADATPIGRDWVEYANSLEGQLSTAETVLKTVRQRLDAAEQECPACEAIQHSLKKSERRLEAAEAEVARHVEALVALYKIDTKSAVHVADVCDTIIDPKGALLGRIRDAARGSAGSPAEKGTAE